MCQSDGLMLHPHWAGFLFVLVLSSSSKLCLPVSTTQEIALGHRAASWDGWREATALVKLQTHQSNDESKKLLGSRVSQAILMRMKQRRGKLAALPSCSLWTKEIK